MTGQIGFLIDVSKCVGCNSCRVACQMHNETGPEVNYRQVTVHESGVFPNVLRHTLSLACNHCFEPACMKVCPVDAIVKRPEDGIVYIDERICNGCYRCVAACPFGAPRKDLAAGTATKCHFCKPRQDLGLQPACVETCLGGALQFGPADELEKMAGKRGVVRRIEGFSDPTYTHPPTRFVKPLKE